MSTQGGLFNALTFLRILQFPETWVSDHSIICSCPAPYPQLGESVIGMWSYFWTGFCVTPKTPLLAPDLGGFSRVAISALPRPSPPRPLIALQVEPPLPDSDP